MFNTCHLLARDRVRRDEGADLVAQRAACSVHHIHLGGAYVHHQHL